MEEVIVSFIHANNITTGTLFRYAMAAIVFWLLAMLYLFAQFYVHIAAEEQSERRRIYKESKKVFGEKIGSKFGRHRFFIERFINNNLLMPVFWYPFSLLITVFFGLIGFFNGPGDWILFITFLALLWYSRETMVSRQAQQVQIRDARARHKEETTPFLVPIFPRADAKTSSKWEDYRIPIRNKNMCFALNVHVEVKDGNGNKIAVIQDRNFLAKDDQMDIAISSRKHVQEIVPLTIDMYAKNFEGTQSTHTRAMLEKVSFEDDGEGGVNIKVVSFHQDCKCN